MARVTLEQRYADPRNEPITGNEPVQGTATPRQALAQFYRAFNGRDLDLMASNWLQSEEIAMDNPLGGIKRGWSEIAPIYERLFRGAAVVQVEFHDYTILESSEMFCAVGRERGVARLPGTELALRIRTSRIFRRTAAGWRQVHHHGSIDDPDLLRRYQAAVRGETA